MSRSRILTGATEILNGGVYGDLTVDALARALHMSKSTLYKYFASKEDVIVALVDAVCAQTEKELDGVDLGAGSARVTLKRIVDIQAGHADRLPRAVVLQHTRLPEACQDRIEVTRARVGSAYRDVLQRGVAAAELRFGDAILAATSLLASSEAAMMAAARGDVKGTRGDAVRTLLDLFMPGLTAGAAAAA
jgi:AcrR family transcriptional regulator